MGQICAQLFGDLVTRMIEIASRKMGESGEPVPDIPWAWVAVGSDGRREQILRTDMDNAFVFESTGDADKDKIHQSTFLKLNKKVVDMMIDAGFARCQGGVMASNPRWCQTDREWIAELRDGDRILEGDGMLRALILYDLRYVAGDKSLCAGIRDTVFKEASSGSIRRLAEMVVSTPPPLSFRGKFVVEKKGVHEGEFDIKSRGLTPIRDAARVFALHYGLKTHHSTGGRLMELASTQPQMEELARLARDGYDLLLRFRTLTGLHRNDDGRYINPADLTKLEREQLANVFDVQRMIQSAVRNQFNLEVQR
jgi:CBS domain-containing protein